MIDGVPSIALVGLGGYGHTYVKALLGDESAGKLKFVAGVDPAPDGCTQLPEIRERGIPVFQSLDEFFRAGRADLVILSTPLQLHCEQTCRALDTGSHVLCEKPLGAHPEQVGLMVEARDRNRRILAIGYQWSFSPAILQLKQDIAAGRFGKPKRLRTRVYWPRDEKYYTRSPWAGRQRDAEGRLVLDSPANNACAHYLHNMFYILGDAVDRSDWPATVTAELYRANPIQNYDTAVIRCRTEHGAEVLFIASHATKNSINPVFCYEFEEATVHYGKFGDAIVAEKRDGTRVNYGSPVSSEWPAKLFSFLETIQSGQPVACGPEAAGAQTACIYAAQQSMPEIADFPRDLVIVEGSPGERRTYVKDLDKTLDRCYEQMSLPSESGVSWSVRGLEIAPGAAFSTGRPVPHAQGQKRATQCRV
ncbi:MAG TPA: Gfo/Idh/MocA family oxidoreductase [Tepidisphaeraceae bacterium]|nr:Gfo/Idh/MocA family oxidoreductase [Tepidisphaeraceae bacterium]